ncbi:MAG TPA: ankyrin repeat domain-containing protein, partial [Candidatus Babeliales bacterium]|nr:ankyrin repeat domain-containing protein [Candidatus Babeliales bacterium]
ERRDLNTIRFLIKHNADINYAQKGMTVLIEAVRTLRPKLVKMLVTTPGININAIADIKVGSALQEVITLQKLARRSNKRELRKLIQIEEILRNYGATQDE